MAENVEGHRGRIGRWLVLAVLLAIGVWVVRSRRAAHADVDAAWPVDIGTGWQVEGEDAAATPPPTATTPAAAPTPRRPSPRPRPAPAP